MSPAEPVISDKLVYLVEDDLSISRLIVTILRDYQFRCESFRTGASLLQRVRQQPPDLVIVDLGLPDMDGMAIVRQVREQQRCGVIILSGRGHVGDRVMGLETGADDYIMKPFEPRELVARIHAVLRRVRKGERGAETHARPLRFAGWQLDRLRRQLVSPQQVVVSLSNAEYRLLNAFVERPGRVLSRDALIDLTRAAGVEVNDRSIDLGVSRLRQKLGDTSRQPALIRTVRGEGYLFDAVIE